ncbi:MAG: hypothetical protein NG737_06080, partial [Omnitrophica bacterium]|nr:hypothetical protein [Candidatus Omnitrophota bacterium]
MVERLAKENLKLVLAARRLEVLEQIKSSLLNKDNIL